MNISIVIPLYNKERFIAKTLSSVLSQTYDNFEVVIVDDGSTDKGPEIVSKFNDARIRLIRQENSGVSAARNRGIEESRGDFIALLDGDDEWKREYLEKQVSLIREFPQCDVYVTGYEFRDQLGNVTYPILNRLKSNGRGILDNYLEVASFSAPIICSINIVVRKCAFESVGGFPIGVRLGEDLITWAKLACKFKIAYDPNHLAIYNFVSQSARIVPKKQPNDRDVVGEEFERLWHKYQLPYLNDLAARWHKMRMVTFVQLQRTKEARKEYTKIKRYIFPTKKDMFWYVLSFMPYRVVKFILKNKDRLK